tara:strand:+ start:224 stop:1084 length:861 start_codon:yes stop_codon:yes gene_type:complete
MINFLNKIVIGTVQFGLDYGISNKNGKTPIEEIKKILIKAKKSNIKMLDTAFAYGESENVLGEINDCEFDLITKYSGNSPILEEFEESLKRLSRKNLYGYLFHSFETYLSNKATLDDMIHLKKNNKIKKIGFSLYKKEELQYIFDNKLEVDLIQIPMNIFNQDFLGILAEAKSKGIEVHVRSVFSQGLIFFHKEEIPNFFEPIKNKIFNFQEKAKELNISLVQLATYFLLQNNNIDKLVIGVNNCIQLEENIKEIKSIPFFDFNEIDFSLFRIEDEKYTNPVNWKK